MIHHTAAAAGGTEELVRDEIDDHIRALRESSSQSTCSAHDTLAEAMILSLRINKQFLGYVSTPAFKIIVSLLTLGGASATLLAAKMMLEIVSGGK